MAKLTDLEMLIASPLIPAFAFSKKLWLKVTVSGIEDVRWSDSAFTSLVLPENQKSVITALVQSHNLKSRSNQTTDDFIADKGRGLVLLLYGPPGVGKTLTAESLAESLRRPLYHISIGELGTDPRHLEQGLVKISDLAHRWGAILLLDEADVFLEVRMMQDVHRNALVTIFLKMLEYFDGILFLTTNRVMSFDPAFQSRIHMALKYPELDVRARRNIFKLFLERTIASAPPTPSSTPYETHAATLADPTSLSAYSDVDLDCLARHGSLNGRQIKNAVRSAQALALSEKSPVTMAHMLRVLEIVGAFEQDSKGGIGYADAMRSYA